MSTPSNKRRPKSIRPSPSLSSSQKFLTMLKPTSAYNGYTRASQSVPEEEGSNRATEDVDLEDLEAGPIIAHGVAQLSAKAEGKRRVSWNPGASEMTTLHPNIHKEDRNHEGHSSDDEVPQSFRVEPTKHGSKFDEATAPGRRQALYSTSGRRLPPTLVDKPKSPSPALQPSETEHTFSPQRRSSSLPQQKSFATGLNNYEKALWNWVNVYNLDAFLQEVYYYYEGNGIYSIALARGLNLLTVGFVIGFSTFLLGCIDYTSLRHQKHTQLASVIVPHCVSRFSGFTLLFFLLFTAFYVWQIFSFVMSIQRLFEMYNFYTYLLKIPDADLPTISWSEVVRRIGAIRDENPLTAQSSNKIRSSDDTSTAKLDAHDIANRILRQENYLIALFNKELLDLRVPLPRLLKKFMVEEEGKGKMLTQALEWNLRFCLMEYLFDQHGKVRRVFLKSKHRAALIDGLERRFIFMGILNAIFAPFIVFYLLMYSFFRYFEQYHKDPSSIGNRRYTLFAQWKFREFNELPHIFTRRLDESYLVANMYIGQFPNEKLTHLMRFISFIAGSFAAVLLLATVLDPDLFLNFEITPHRTVFFYLGVFGAFLTVARGMIPEDNHVFDPELLMSEVITYTHFMPDSWKTHLHSKRVHEEFGELFALKVLIYVQEILSVILTPFVLWFSLPRCAPAIIDFFREFSVHVDGRGYVCSFAEFNFERHGNVKFGAPARIQNKKMISNEGKMEKSFLNFKAANPDWKPADPSGSVYLSRMADLNALHRYPYYRQRPPPDSAGVNNFQDALAVPTRLPLDTPNTTERVQEYDLRQSRLAAIRRRGMAGSAGLVNMSTLLATGPATSASMFVDTAYARSVTLGDSHHASEELQPSTVAVTSDIPDDIPVDGGSTLEDSFVDGARHYRTQREEEEEDGVEDGGVLGLLAQIYGRRDGAPVGF